MTDSITALDHFFLIPLPYEAYHLLLKDRHPPKNRPHIRMQDGRVWVDHIPTTARPQAIPFTTPFWYFHYDPNLEQTPFQSMTLNLNPACPEKCTLCAGAKTGRVNNGMDDTLSSRSTLDRVFAQHPEAAAQLDSVAIVTGCFRNFDVLTDHLKDVRRSVESHASPSRYLVLEHNVVTEEQFDVVIRELGYEVFITLECFDQDNRNIALNGKVGRKGRDSNEFLDMMWTYARYLDTRPELGKRFVKVTYLMGIDSLETSEALFQKMADMNRQLKHAVVMPWLSIFTPYDRPMRAIQQPDFSLRFLLDAQELCRKYFDEPWLASESGGTAQGFARGLF
ncbi:hypothetical protein LVJ94_17870 [Pendulispora rubella]|uniref:Radical SAM protein n=1 Tax=Pendulispora rubella TaxID=2741070 RepID=A0ABZ2LHQ6_9BACT